MTHVATRQHTRLVTTHLTTRVINSVLCCISHTIYRVFVIVINDVPTHLLSLTQSLAAAKVLVFENAPTLLITGGGTEEGGALHAGTYDFTLQVTGYKQLESGSLQFGSRYASTSVSLTLVDLPIPDVVVSVNRAITAISEAGQINPNTKIVLTGVVTNYDAAATRHEDTKSVRIEGQWEVSVSGGNALDLTNPNIAPLGNAKPIEIELVFVFCGMYVLARFVGFVGVVYGTL
jgi:hypothetical protein